MLVDPKVSKICCVIDANMIFFIYPHIKQNRETCDIDRYSTM